MPDTRPTHEIALELVSEETCEFSLEIPTLAVVLHEDSVNVLSLDENSITLEIDEETL